jgi:glycerol-3-phosphate dehydrogenase (NAD(P)+)
MAGLQIRDVGVIGGGAWGLSLANLLGEKGFRVLVWDRNSDRIRFLRENREDPQRLPGVKINERVEFTENLLDLSNLDLHILTVKSEAVEEVAERLKEIKIRFLISGIKGFVGRGLNLVSEYLEKKLEGIEVFVLGGPSIALEVCNKVPTSVVIAGKNEESLKKIQEAFSTNYFRVYRNLDVLGVELGGALKNVIAIAAGICDGLGLGENSKGALLTRGVYEMARFGVRLGAKMETFFGLAGLGDVITTSFSKNSRNRYVGEMLGKGKKIEEILGGMVMVAEGVRTAYIVRDKAREIKIDMPLTEMVCRVMNGEIGPREAINELMTRELKREFYEGYIG